MAHLATRLLLLCALLVPVAACGNGDGSEGSSGLGDLVGDPPAVVENQAPTAVAGNDREVSTGTAVALDGSDSGDPDGDLVTYAWSLVSRPAGSAAALSDAAAARPSFAADVDGVYEIMLVVSDGDLVSEPVSITVTAVSANARPSADAGPDQIVLAGTVVELDGRGSGDPDGDKLEPTWSFLTLPASSEAEIEDPGAATTRFLADAGGIYEIRLVVDDGMLESAADFIRVTAFVENTPPVAEAGDDRTVEVSTEVVLDGSLSINPDGDPLVYAWSFASVPPGSEALLLDADGVSARFVPDVAGAFVVELVVNDGAAQSLPDRVVITATEPPPPVTGCAADPTALLCDVLDGSTSGARDGGSFSGGGFRAPGQIVWDLGRHLTEGAFQVELLDWDPSSSSPQHRHDKQHILNLYESSHGAAHSADSDGTGFFNVRTGVVYNELFKFLSSTRGFDEREESRLSPPNGQVDPGQPHTVRVEWSGATISVFLDGQRLRTHQHGRSLRLRYVFLGTDNSPGDTYGPQHGVRYRNVGVWPSPSGGT